jgi:hypothetical protein
MTTAAVISDRDIRLAAKAMIPRGGSNAGIEAAERADEHLETENLDLSVTWQRIMTAIEKLQAAEPAPGEMVRLLSNPVGLPRIHVPAITGPELRLYYSDQRRS